MVPLARRFGVRGLHAVCLLAAGLGMLAIPRIHSEALVMIPAIGVGLGWASLMGNPFIMLARSIPPARTGVYMGFFNVFIVVPMLIQTLTVPLYYNWLLGGDGRNAISLAGILMLLAAASTFFVRLDSDGDAQKVAQ
jgi:maltose/moltooligosaccharide transporter